MSAATSVDEPGGARVATVTDIRRAQARHATAKTIMVAIDGQSDSYTALDRAVALAQETGAELILVGIADLALASPEADVEALSTPESPYEFEQALLDQCMQQLLDRVAQALQGTVRVRTTVNWGSTAGGLLDAAHRFHPDLIVVPMTGAGVVGHLLRGHGTRRLVRRAGVPVMVVPPDSTGR